MLPKYSQINRKFFKYPTAILKRPKVAALTPPLSEVEIQEVDTFPTLDFKSVATANLTDKMTKSDLESFYYPYKAAVVNPNPFPPSIPSAQIETRSSIKPLPAPIGPPPPPSSCTTATHKIAVSLPAISYSAVAAKPIPPPVPSLPPISMFDYVNPKRIFRYKRSFNATGSSLFATVKQLDHDTDKVSKALLQSDLMKTKNQEEETREQRKQKEEDDNGDDDDDDEDEEEQDDEEKRIDTHFSFWPLQIPIPLLDRNLFLNIQPCPERFLYDTLMQSNQNLDRLVDTLNGGLDGTGRKGNKIRTYNGSFDPFSDF